MSRERSKVILLTNLPSKATELERASFPDRASTWLPVSGDQYSEYTHTHSAAGNSYTGLLCELKVGGELYQYYDIQSLNTDKYSEYTTPSTHAYTHHTYAHTERLPYSVRVLLESAVRSCDGFQVTTGDVDNIINWEESQGIEIPFRPARVILQDFTYVYTVVQTN